MSVIPVESKFEILEMLSQAAIVTDVEGQVVYWNSIAEQMYGWQRNEIIGKSISAITPPAVSTDGELIMKALIRGEAFEGLFRVKGKDGNEFTVKSHNYPIKRDGKVAWIVGVSDTVYKKEYATLDSAYLLRLITDNLPDTLLFRAETSTDGRLKILYSGSHVENILGYTPQELIDHPLAVLQHYSDEDRDRLLELLSTEVAKSNTVNTTFDYLHPSGEQKFIKIYARQYHTLYDSKIWDGVCMDVTDTVNKDKQIKSMLESKDRFISAVTHDLRSPLQTIRGLVNLLNLSPTLNAENKVYLEAINKSLDKSDAIIADLLEIAEMDDIDFEIELTAVEVDELLENSIQKYIALAQSQSKRFSFHTGLSSDMKILANKSKFNRMIDNILSNAYKFTKSGDSIELSTFEEYGFIHIIIQDSGIGIPPSLINKVFDRFTKAKRPGLQGEKPTGLGMSIVKQIAQLHHGEVMVSSKEEEGTQVKLTFPCVL